VESGLQLGIDVTSTSEPALRISLKNVGTQPRDLDSYNLEFTTHTLGEREQPVFDLIALKAYPSSLLSAISAHLQPGEIREFIYPLSQLICVVNRQDVPFRPLLAQGYTVRASFDFPGVTLATPEFSLGY
jgi:hypothetical protein